MHVHHACQLNQTMIGTLGARDIGQRYWGSDFSGVVGVVGVDCQTATLSRANAWMLGLVRENLPATRMSGRIRGQAYLPELQAAC